MKRYLFLGNIWFLILVGQIYAQAQAQFQEKVVDFPEVPRITAYEAYNEYKAGKALLIHAGGELFQKKHIMGAYDVPAGRTIKGETPLPALPMTGLSMFVYCY
jgi:hypothetical protein